MAGRFAIVFRGSVVSFSGLGPEGPVEFWPLMHLDESRALRWIQTVIDQLKEIRDYGAVIAKVGVADKLGVNLGSIDRVDARHYNQPGARIAGSRIAVYGLGGE